jgi:acyl carrier protein
MSFVEEKVKQIIAKHFGIDPDKVTESASFTDDLGADSLDTVELAMAFEEEFGCEIPDEVIEKILTVGDANRYFEANAKSRSKMSGTAPQ